MGSAVLGFVSSKMALDSVSHEFLHAVIECSSTAPQCSDGDVGSGVSHGDSKTVHREEDVVVYSTKGQSQNEKNWFESWAGLNVLLSVAGRKSAGCDRGGGCGSCGDASLASF